jgi:hypothetical protein
MSLIKVGLWTNSDLGIEVGEKSLKDNLKVGLVEDKFEFSSEISLHLRYISMLNARQEKQPLHFLSIINEWFLESLRGQERNCDCRRPV